MHRIRTRNPKAAALHRRWANGEISYTAYLAGLSRLGYA